MSPAISARQHCSCNPRTFHWSSVHFPSTGRNLDRACEWWKRTGPPPLLGRWSLTASVLLPLLQCSDDDYEEEEEEEEEKMRGGGRGEEEEEERKCDTIECEP